MYVSFPLKVNFFFFFFGMTLMHLHSWQSHTIYRVGGGESEKSRRKNQIEVGLLEKLYQDKMNCTMRIHCEFFVIIISVVRHVLCVVGLYFFWHKTFGNDFFLRIKMQYIRSSFRWSIHCLARCFFDIQILFSIWKYCFFSSSVFFRMQNKRNMKLFKW